MRSEMGLGKTRQVLVFLFSLMLSKKVHSALILSPVTPAEATWVKEAKHIVGRLEEHKFGRGRRIRIVPVTSTMKSAQRKFELRKARKSMEAGPATLVISTHSLIMKSATGFNASQTKQAFDCIVVDEAHAAKNTKTHISKNVRKVSRFSALFLLTGTPIMNRIEVR